MADDLDCTCGHPQSRHKSLKLGCRGCDIGCSRFEPETRPEPVEPVPAEELAAVADEAAECCVGEPFMGDPGGLHTFDCPVYQASQAALLERSKAAQPVPEPVLPPSTSARLREVEAELAAVNAAAGRDIAKPDEPLVDRVADLLRGRTEATERALELAEEVRDLRDLAEAMPCGWCDGTGVAPEERFGRDQDGAPVVDGPQPCPEGCEVVAWLNAERNDAADVERDLAAARREIESLGAQLEHAEQYARDLQDNGDVPPIDGLVLVDFDAQHCRSCGWTSSYETHHHPTIPVRVVIHRTEGQA